MTLNSVFFNNYGRLRSGWRFSAFLASFIICGVILGIFVQSFFGTAAADNSLFLLVNSAVSLLAALGLGWMFGRLLEDLPLKALGLAFTKGWPRHLIWGCFLGAWTLMIAVGIAAAASGYSFAANSAVGSTPVLRSLVISFLVFAVAAAFEEVLFRGYILQTFSRAGLSWLAIALTALFFALVHAGNPSANAISTLNTGLAGIWFGVAYLKTRDLWFPFGIHLLWNWTQGSVFGIEVSGLKEISRSPLLREIDRGPDWITGGDYGIEAGISTTIAILLSIAMIYYLPFLKADEELVELTSREQPVRSIVS